jgi:hypothetical protein
MAPAMAALARHRQAWLLEIGQRLKVEYDAIAAAPIPSRLASLIKQAESIPHRSSGLGADRNMPPQTRPTA